MQVMPAALVYCLTTQHRGLLKSLRNRGFQRCWMEAMATKYSCATHLTCHPLLLKAISVTLFRLSTAAMPVSRMAPGIWLPFSHLCTASLKHPSNVLQSVCRRHLFSLWTWPFTPHTHLVLKQCLCVSLLPMHHQTPREISCIWLTFIFPVRICSRWWVKRVWIDTWRDKRYCVKCVP